MVCGLPSVAGLLCLVPAFSVATSKATNKELRVHAQMVMLGNPAEIGIHVDPRAQGALPYGSTEIKSFQSNRLTPPHCFTISSWGNKDNCLTLSTYICLLMPIKIVMA
jgi:hypothetical protein